MNLKGKILHYSFECLSVIFSGDKERVLRWTESTVCARDIAVGTLTLIAILGFVFAVCSFIAYKVVGYKWSEITGKHKPIKILHVVMIAFWAIFIISVLVIFFVCIFA